MLPSEFHNHGGVDARRVRVVYIFDPLIFWAQGGGALIKRLAWLGALRDGTTHAQGLAGVGALGCCFVYFLEFWCGRWEAACCR